jgi:hypothetical protein
MVRFWQSFHFGIHPHILPHYGMDVYQCSSPRASLHEIHTQGFDPGIMLPMSLTPDGYSFEVVHKSQRTSWCCSTLVALALDEEGLHVPVFQDLKVAPLGAFPCAIERNARSDCATTARARSFLWIA